MSKLCSIEASCLQKCGALRGASESGLDPISALEAARQVTGKPIVLCANGPRDIEGQASRCNLDPRVQAALGMVPVVAQMLAAAETTNQLVQAASPTP